MKATGIVRRLDDLGRVVIPKEIRRRLGWMEGDPVEIGLNGNVVTLEKYQVGCLCCGREGDTMEFAGREFCPRCAARIGRLAEHGNDA